MGDPVVYLFLCLGVAGLICMALAAHQSFRSYESKKWIQCDGQILAHHYRGADNADIVLKVIGGLLSPPSHEVLIDYEYLWKGQWLRGTRVCFGKRSEGTRKRAFEYLGKFPAHRVVTVYVNPKNPRDAVLLPGVSRSTIQLCVLGVVLGVVGFYLAFVVIQAG